MNRRIRNFAICFIAAFVMAAVMPFQILTAFAATAKITFNDPKPAVGTEFTVTVKAATTDGNMGGADIVLSYDPAVIEFVSGNNANGGAGTVRLVGTMDSANTKSFDFSLKFKALQAGETTISVSSSELYDADMQAMTVSHTGNSAVKVQAPSTYSSEASLSSLKISPGTLTPAFSPEVTSYTASVGAEVNKIAVSAERKDSKAKLVVSGDSNLQPGKNQVVCKVTAEDGKTVKNYTITVTKAAAGESQAQTASESAGETEAAVVGELKAEIDGTEYSVASSFDQSLLPAGYTASSAVYQDTEIMAGVNGDLTVIYLQDEGGAGSFWFYNSESGELAPYATIHVSEKNITVLPIDDSVEIPEGFSETTIQLNGDYKVEGWVWATDTEQRYCVVYGMNENGEKGLYRYDIGEKTIQRYFEDPAIQSSYSDEEVEAYINEFNEIYKLYRLRLVIIVALGAVCVILLVMVILLLKKKGGDHDGEDSSRGSSQAPGASSRKKGTEAPRQIPPSGKGENQAPRSYGDGRRTAGREQQSASERREEAGRPGEFSRNGKRPERREEACREIPPSRVPRREGSGREASESYSQRVRHEEAASREERGQRSERNQRTDMTRETYRGPERAEEHRRGGYTRPAQERTAAGRDRMQESRREQELEFEEIRRRPQSQRPSASTENGRREAYGRNYGYPEERDSYSQRRTSPRPDRRNSPDRRNRGDSPDFVDLDE